MEPTLLIGDMLLASKYPYGYGAASLPIHVAFPETGRLFGAMPKRGDVVVFRWPGDRSQVWVKRVVGLPGDRVQMRQGALFINGQPAALKPDGIGEVEDDNGADEPARRYVETLPGGVSHTIFKMADHGRLDDTPEVTVPKDRLFVMGDNRDNSADSRVPVREGGRRIAADRQSGRPGRRDRGGSWGISPPRASRSGPGCPVFESRGFSPACIRKPSW